MFESSGRRCLHSTSSVFRNDLSKIKDLILRSGKLQPFNEQEGKSNEVPLVQSSKQFRKGRLGSKKREHLIKPPWFCYNTKLNEDYKSFTPTEQNTINHFFYTAKVIHEWSVQDFNEIPSEKVRHKYKGSVGNSLKEGEDSKKLFPGKTEVPFEMINGLPEVIFLGRSNAGKSTLLNSLITELGNTNLLNAARTSKRAGFTKTLNCFNIGRKLRIIDSPGYGHKSTDKQGSLTLDYIANRKELVRCYLLISANHGFTSNDEQIMEYLTSIGRPFEIVFTKMDKLAQLKNLDTMIDQSGIKNFPTLPKLIFTNSMKSKSCSRRYGMDYLRFSLFESCNLL